MRSILAFVLAAALTPAICQVQTGKASFYADKFEGNSTASGEIYKHSKLTAAHRSLPFGTRVRVTNLGNSKSVDVTVNDRGPYVDGRVIDLSRSAAEQLDFINAGLAEVRVEVLDPGDGKGGGQIVPVDRVSVEQKEYYDFNVTKLQPKGFGVQIGTYQELVNLMRLADDLKSSYRKKANVQVKVVNGVKYYSLSLGEFSTRKKATQFATGVKKEFPDAFVVEYGR